MDFAKRKNRNIVSSTKSTDNGLGVSTVNGMLGSKNSSSFSRSFARQEINGYFSDGSSSSMGDSMRFMLLSNIGSVQDEQGPQVNQVPRVNPGANNVDSSILSTRDLDPPHDSHVESFNGDLDSYIIPTDTQDK